MKLGEINNSTAFKGRLNNKYFLKSLEIIANHPATFIAGTTLFMSSIVRPCTILLTPKTDKENKKYAAADSFSSGLVKFAITEAVAIPVENAVRNIEKTPEKFLNSNTLKNLQDKGKNIAENQNFKFASQLIKLSTGFFTAIPKSLIAVSLIPFIMNFAFHTKQKKKTQNYITPDTHSQIFNQFYDNSISFKGNKEIAEKTISRIFNSNSFQKFVTKYSSKEADIARNISLATDALLAGSFIFRTKSSKKINEDKKNPLIYNKLISTALSILLGYKIDKFVQKKSVKFLNNFKNANINNPKLSKYIQGINILRPTIILALLYYGILPIFSIFTADKIDKYQKRNN